MYIFDLNKNISYKDAIDKVRPEESYIILCDQTEIESISNILKIDNKIHTERVDFEKYVSINKKNYDFIRLNSMDFENDYPVFNEIDIYISYDFLVIVSSEDSYIYNFVKNIILEDSLANQENKIGVYMLNQYIIRELIMRGFEFIEKIEENIIFLEDKIRLGIKPEHIEHINQIRYISRKAVKCVRPLIYIAQRSVYDNMQYMRREEIDKNDGYMNMQSIDFSIDKLYQFAISTRDMSDRLLSIYSSKAMEKTNILITRLTILTAIAAPLTIITGIYGMNFKFMPELYWKYSYPAVILIMITVVSAIIYFFRKNKMI